MAHREGVLRTRPPNRDFLNFRVFCGAEGISGAQQKRFVQKRPPLPLPAPVGEMAFLPVWPARKSWARPPLERGLSTRRRMLSDGPKWLIVWGVLRTRPPNRDFLGFCVFCGAEGISRAWKKRFVRKRPPPAKQTLSEADRPENLRCRLRAPLLTRARQVPWSCRTQQKGRGGR